MTWNRDKKSWRVLGGGGLKNDLESWQELLEGGSVKLRHTLACMVLGGRFKKWLGLVTRRLGEVKLWSWDILLHVGFWGGGLENDLESWQEVLDRGILLHVGFFLGGGLENDLASNKKSWRGEAVKLRNTLACRVLGGRFRKWLGF